MSEERVPHSVPVALAHDAIVAFVTEARVLEVPAGLPAVLQGRAGTFVSLTRAGEEFAGCMGSIEPREANIALEVIHNAITAASRDPRVDPITRQDLPGLTVKVDILSALEPVAGIEAFDPKRYGMVLNGGWKRGVLLPDLEGVETPEQQYAIVCRKAGISPGEPVEFFRFTVTRYH